MSYVLGDVTLPSPTNFRREYIERSASNDMLDGTTKKDITNRKERFILEFNNISQTDVSTILSEYNLETTRDFEVTETNLTISSTQVHIDIGRRNYPTKGTDYREELTLLLTEVV